MGLGSYHLQFVAVMWASTGLVKWAVTICSTISYVPSVPSAVAVGVMYHLSSDHLDAASFLTNHFLLPPNFPLLAILSRSFINNVLAKKIGD